jgi:hypothetical protein
VCVCRTKPPLSTRRQKCQFIQHIINGCMKKSRRRYLLVVYRLPYWSCIVHSSHGCSPNCSRKHLRLARYTHDNTHSMCVHWVVIHHSISISFISISQLHTFIVSRTLRHQHLDMISDSYANLLTDVSLWHFETCAPHVKYHHHWSILSSVVLNFN